MNDLNNKAKHLVWIMVDSARSYVSEEKDDRDKLEIMFDWCKEATNFENTITSAPSSVMSFSCMLTSIYPYYIGLNYDDFRYDSEIFPSLPEIWKSHGREFYSFCNSREIRTIFKDIINHADKKYYPNGLSDRKPNWTNKEVNDVLQNFIREKSFDTPTCIFVWFNIRKDPKTNHEVKRCMDLIKESGIWDESLVILTADHGYLDPSRGYTPEKLKKMGLTHDNLLTEDQVKIPFLVKAPDMKPINISESVFTIDFLPTILDYFNIPYPENSFSMQGKSFLKLLRGEKPSLKLKDRLVRIDGRFMHQDGRRTSVRSNKYKYEYIHDTKTENFFDIEKDFFEYNNLISSLNNLQRQELFRMKKYFIETEKESHDFKIKLISNKLIKDLENKLEHLPENAEISIQKACSKKEYTIVTQIIKKYFPKKSFLQGGVSRDFNILVYNSRHANQKNKINARNYIFDISGSNYYKFMRNMDFIQVVKKQFSLFKKYKSKFVIRFLERRFHIDFNS